jgi:hypothetical protein
VTRLERRDFTDRVLIGFAVLVFALVCGYIFKVRELLGAVSFVSAHLGNAGTDNRMTVSLSLFILQRRAAVAFFPRALYSPSAASFELSSASKLLLCLALACARERRT